MSSFEKKLTEAAVIDIMTDKVSSAKKLAERYGVSTHIIYKIHKGEAWKHISCDPQYTRRNFLQEKRKLNENIVRDIKNGVVTDLYAVAKEYNVKRKYLVGLLNKNRIQESWKTIPINV
mgnify:CR=1 FL=1